MRLDRIYMSERRIKRRLRTVKVIERRIHAAGLEVREANVHLGSRADDSRQDNPATAVTSRTYAGASTLSTGDDE